MGVLDVVDGIVAAAAGPEVEVEVDLGVGRVARQRVPGGVDADGSDQVLERDDRAGALAHAQRLAVLQQVDHLADQDLEVDPGLVAERGAHRHHPRHVAVVVSAEHDDRPVEPALTLVEVVGQVARDVGRLPVGLDDDPVLVVAVVGGAQPACAVALVHLAELVEPGDRAVDGTGVVQVVLVEVDVEVDPEVVQALLDLPEHPLDALGPEGLGGLGVRQLRRTGVRGEHGSGDDGDGSRLNAATTRATADMEAH